MPSSRQVYEWKHLATKSLVIDRLGNSLPNLILLKSMF